MRFSFFSLVLLAVLLFSIACEKENDRLPTVRSDIEMRRDGRLDFVRPDGTPITSINIEIAETAEARTRGLMNRRSLSLNEGMLFIFEEVDTLSFWMRNTPIPLDMIFVDPDSEIVNIVKRTTPLSDENYTSTAPAKYVIEVRAGFTDRFGITDSTRVRWQRTSG